MPLKVLPIEVRPRPNDDPTIVHLLRASSAPGELELGDDQVFGRGDPEPPERRIVDPNSARESRLTPTEWLSGSGGTEEMPSQS